MKKEKLKIVFNSNIIISAALFYGLPADVIDLVLLETVEGVISEEISEEVIEVLTEKFSLSQKRLDKIEKRFRRDFTLVRPTQRILASRDPDDNKTIEAAVEGDCQYIITGDKDLLVLKRYKKIKIVTPKEFLEEFTI